MKRLMPACAALAVLVAAPALALPLDPLAFGALGALDLASGQYTLDTGGTAPTLYGPGHALLATGTFAPQADAWNPWVAVFDFSSVQVAAGAVITARGPNPLALLSRGDFSFDGRIDAAGSPGGGQGAGSAGAGGPGGGRGGAGGSGEGEAGLGPGGGAGGYPGLGNCSWGEGGAYGGAGSNWNPCRSAAPAYGDPALLLQGGSGGGAGGANLFGSGPGGGGAGGGVEFGAVGRLTLGGGSRLDVSGAQGGGGLAVNAGGGSGGGALLHATSIALLTSPAGLALIDASGFSGGRISFLTASGGVEGNTSGVGVGNDASGHPGVISFGALAAVPEPASAWLLLAGGAALAAWRRRQQT